MGSTEEPDRKRRHFSSSTSPTAKKPNILSSSDEKKVNPGMLQYQNQKLSQQLDVQRDEINALEIKYNLLKNKQSSHTSTLDLVQSAWGQLVSNVKDLVAHPDACPRGYTVDTLDFSEGRSNSQIPDEETFLQRLLNKGATDRCNGDSRDPSESISPLFSEPAIRKTIEHLVCKISSEVATREVIHAELRLKVPNEDDAQLLLKRLEDLLNEMSILRLTLDDLFLKHKDLASRARLYHKNFARDQADKRLLTGELQETIMDLAAMQQKIVNLSAQTNSMPSGVCAGMSHVDDGEKSHERPTKDRKALEHALEEVKGLALRRLKEIEEVHRETANLTEQLHQLKAPLEDARNIPSSHVYVSLSSSVDGLNEEVKHWKALVETSQAEQDDTLNRANDDRLKVDACNNVFKANLASMERLAELELKVQDSLNQRNDLQISLDEVSHVLDRQDKVAEFEVMVSTLQKEMSMMQHQLDKYKEAVLGAESLRSKVESISILLENKASENRFLSGRLVDHALEAHLLRDEVKLLKETEQELKLIIDMYESEPFDNRDIPALKEAERKVLRDIRRLKAALEDNNLELRVKAANEAEATCQKRLAAAEAEVAEHLQQLDASNRMVIELKEAAKMKSKEHDAYLIEIETIGQAYEDMQAQNRRLLKQISKRDEYNIRLVSDSVKAKQLQTFLLDEKQDLVHQINLARCVGEEHKQKMIKLEEQVAVYLEQMREAVQDGRKHASLLGALERKSAEVSTELTQTKFSIEAFEKEVEKRKVKIGEIQGRLEKERIAKEKALDELTSLRSKAACMGAQNDGSLVIEKLQDEIKECKAILRCSVCHDRPKEVVITKCYHLFCSPCIQRNLEIRHRKCPGCGIHFGQNDVRNEGFTHTEDKKHRSSALQLTLARVLSRFFLVLWHNLAVALGSMRGAENVYSHIRDHVCIMDNAFGASTFLMNGLQPFNQLANSLNLYCVSMIWSYVLPLVDDALAWG